MTTVGTREVGGCAARRLARVAFVALIILSPFRGRIDLVVRRTSQVYSEYTDFLLSAGDIALVCTVGFWLLAQVLQRRHSSWGPRLLAWPVAVLLGVAAVGIPFSADPALAAYTTVRFVVLIALALYVINEVERVQQVVLAVAAAIALQAVVGIGQVVAQRSLSLASLGEHVLLPQLGVSVVTTGAGLRVLRAYGLTDHPNILGGILVIAVLVLAGAFASGRARSPADSLVAPLSLVVIVLAGACAFLTFSRGSWIAATIGMIVLTAMVALGPERSALSRVGLAVLALAMGVAPFVAPYHAVVAARADRSGTISTEARSVDEREALSTVTSRIVRDHPILGVGIGNLPLAMRSAEPRFHYDYQPAAVVLLDVTAETGIVGGIAYLVVLVAPWIALLRKRNAWTPELAGVSAALAAVTIVGVFDYYTWAYAPGRIWAWLILGLWAGTYQRATTGANDHV